MNKVNQLQANCCIITTNEGQFLQSYNSIVAAKLNDGTIQLDVNTWDYSTTTRKHRFLFLGEDSKTIKSKIGKGVYKLVDLNN